MPLVDGLQSGNIYFNHNAKIPQDVVTVSGTGVSPKFSATPLNINFGNVRNETSKKDSVTVTNIGTADLIISSLSSSNALFTFTPAYYTLLPGSSAKFFVTFSPIVDGLQSGNIYFNHNAKNPKDSVSVTGTGVSPKFTVSPLSLNFGNLRNDLIKKDSVTVTNTGTMDLIISSFTSSNNLFKVTGTTGTLTPGSTQKYYITFSPIADGLQTGFIYFNHNAKIPKDSISVTGTGVSPKFSVTPLSLDFGKVRNETSKKDSVTVTNTGTIDLIISSLNSSNTLYTFTPSTGTITPGSTATFYITFSPLVDGLQSGNIYFNHNAKIPQDVVTVSGTGVSPKFAVSPINLNFGNLRNETSKKDSVTVTNTGTIDLIISSLNSSNTLFTFTPSTGTIAPGSSAKFYVTFSPLVDGFQSGYIYFNHNAKIPKDSIGVTGTGVSPIFAVSPISLNFGNVRNDLSKRDSVTVTNTGTADLIISSLTSSNALFTFTPAYYTLLPGSSAKFYVTFSPLVDGFQSGYIYFNHNAKIPKDSIRITGTGVSPKFTVNPIYLNFGNVRNDLSKTLSVIVTNTGTADLIINNVTSSNNLFTVSPNIGILTPGATQIYNVTFSPVEDGLQAGYIYFNHNAKIPKDSISLTGTGVSPKFSVNPSSLDFGDVRVEFSNKTEFVTVTNIGTCDLIISSVTSSNRAFTVTPANGILSPGATQIYYITFAPTESGEQNGFIYFNHNAKNLKDSISITGKGVSPQFILNILDMHYGNVLVGTSKRDSVTVTNTGELDLIIKSVSSTNTLSFSVTPTNDIIKPGEKHTFYITFSPLSNGWKHTYIYFYHNAPNAFSYVDVGGNGVSPIFSAIPKSLDFGNVKSRISKLDSVIVTNIGKSDLIISSVTSSNNIFSTAQTTGTIKPGYHQKFYVTFSPLSNGIQNGYIIFNHNALNSKDSVSVTGSTGIEPEFTVSSSNVDFGALLIGTTKQKSVIVTNTGTINLLISDIISSDNHYTITPTVSTIPAGKTQELFITFAPTVVGQLNGTIEFTHNVGKDVINVTGLGITVISIKDARELPIGTEFAVEGIVTRSLGSYTRIQDQTGALTIVQTSGVFFTEVSNLDIKMADKVFIQGRISEMDFLKVINGSDLTGYLRLSRTNLLPTPVKVTLSELANNGEQYESRLITLDNLTIATVKDIMFNESTTYQTIDKSDISNTVAIRIGKSADTQIDGTSFIGNNITFEGVLSQSSLSNPANGYQLTPVLSSDLRFSTGINEMVNNNQNYLSDNYPNPFNFSTTIEYTVEKANNVTLKVSDELGNEVTTLVNKFQDAGSYSVNFSTLGLIAPLNNGIYFYRLKVGTFVTSKTMIFVK
jgi:hypothetical protein